MRFDIITSFRPFRDGDKNTSIQENFLDSLERIAEFVDLRLIAVQFGEQGIREALTKFSIRSTLIDLGRLDRARYCLSDVLYHGLAATTAEHTFYTTCDVELTLELLMECTLSGFDSAIPTPFLEVDSFSGASTRNTTGLDVFYFSRHARLRLQESSYLREFRLLDWGMFDHQIVISLSMLGLTFGSLPALATLTKYSNDRESAMEANEWMIRSHRINRRQIRRQIGLRLGLSPLLTASGLAIKLGKARITDFIQPEIAWSWVSQVVFLARSALRQRLK